MQLMEFLSRESEVERKIKKSREETQARISEIAKFEELVAKRRNEHLYFKSLYSQRKPMSEDAKAEVMLAFLLTSHAEISL